MLDFIPGNLSPGSTADKPVPASDDAVDKQNSASSNKIMLFSSVLRDSVSLKGKRFNIHDILVLRIRI